MNFEEFSFLSSTGKNTIRCIKSVPENQEIKGVVQIVHGISEHIDRYRDFMSFLSENGFVCVGDDHLGHGKTFQNEKEKGAFYETDGWMHAAKDLVILHDITAGNYKGVPYILFGHSMGSFLTRTYIAEYTDKYDIAVLSGTGHQSKALVAFGNAAAGLLVKASGYYSEGTLLDRLSMGSYLKKIKNPRTKSDWLSRNNDEVDKFVSDDHCGFVAKTGLYADLLKGVAYVTNMDNVLKIPKDKPVLFISGSEDPVGDYGEGVKRAYQCFIKAGIKDVSIKLYEGGRHEMLNEINKDEVYRDILEWILLKIN